MKLPKRKRHWRTDVHSAFKRAIKRYESGDVALDDIEDLYKLGAPIAAQNRGIKDSETIKRMAEFTEKCVEEDHAIEPSNKHQVIFHFVSAYLYAHVPAGILDEIEADRVMEYLNDTLDLFIEPELAESGLDAHAIDELSDGDLHDSDSDVQMPAYDPEVAPDKLDWLATDEGEQMDRIMVFHESHGEFGDSLEAHVAMHMAVETQIVTDTPEVETTLNRLMKQGLSRHDAIHAIGFVLAESVQEILTSDESAGEDANERYYVKLSRFNASDWLNQAAIPRKHQ